MISLHYTRFAAGYRDEMRGIEAVIPAMQAHAGLYMQWTGPWGPWGSTDETRLIALDQ